MKAKSEPSKAALREMPEIDDGTHRFLGRGLLVEKARRSFATFLIERETVDRLGGVEVVQDILRALAKSTRKAKAPRSKKRAA